MVENTGTKEATYLQLDISKVQKELNWYPRYDIEGSLKIVAEWYKSYYSDPMNIDTMTERQIAEYSSGAKNE